MTLPTLAAAALCVAALLFAGRAVWLHRRAEPFRFGCLWPERAPGPAAPEESRFAPQGVALRRAGRRAAAGCAAAAALAASM